MATHIFTSVAANYLAKARVLANSIKKFHPEFVFHLVLCDAIPAWFSVDREPFDFLITLDHLKLENPRRWIFEHTLVELTTAVKALVLEKLLALSDCEQVLYFDPDIVVLWPLDRLMAEFASASILLTPHLAEPETTTEAIRDNEFSVLQHGVFNLGFIGVKNSPEGRRFAGWWADRLKRFCYDDIPHGLFTDQRWADLAPVYFPDHQILRDAAYNVCTWNLTHRTVTGSVTDGFLVNGAPLAFYHFSGFDSGAQRVMLDKYGRSMPALFELREWYIGECERMGQGEVAAIPWAYGFFDNGEPVLAIHRRTYRERPDLQSSFPDPYATADESQSYLAWFNLNDETERSRKNDPVPPELSTPDYRVFVIATAADVEFVRDTLDAVWQRTWARAIFLIAPATVLAQFAIVPPISPIAMEADRYDDFFAAVLQQHGDKDALLIRAGGIPPDKWDLRLAWSAVRQPGIASVSPVDDRLVDKSGRFRSGGRDDVLDRLCYAYRQPTDAEVASFSPECVYVRAEAVRDVSAFARRLNPAALRDQAARLRFTHRLATHICVSWRRPRADDPETRPQHSEPAALTRLRDRIRGHSNVKGATPAAVARSMTGPNLHVMHTWGGGLEQWVGDYCKADTDHENFVLKSVGPTGLFGKELHLYRNIDDAEPIESWPLEPGIKATVGAHAGYREFLSQIVRKHGIERIIVSSLIGHSVDCLRESLPTVLVCHDYYPFCSAINITFEGVCRSCEPERLTACTQENPLNRFFPNVAPIEWLHLRSDFVAAVRKHGVMLIAPSPSVRDHYVQLLPELAPTFRVIAHGTAALDPVSLAPAMDVSKPLRIVIVGNLSPHKGGLLFESVVPELLSFCDVSLVGSGILGKPYAENPTITVIPTYQREQLPHLLAELKPDLGVLLSVVPETFSFTLRELQQFALPVLATNLGGFADRIEDGVTGLLCEPNAVALIEKLRTLAEDREPLARIHENLKVIAHRSVEDMLRDYEQLVPVRYSSARYFHASESASLLPEKSLQLFWRTAEERFEERNSVVVAPFGGKRQIVRLSFLSPLEPIEQLRLDLSFEPGLLFLYDLSLRDQEDRVVWHWDRDVATLRSTTHHGVVFFESEKGKGNALLQFEDEDPYLILPVEASSLAELTRGGYLEVEFSLGTSSEHLQFLLSSGYLSQRMRAETERHNEELARELTIARAENEDYRTRLEQLEPHVQGLENFVAEVQNSVSWRITRPGRALIAAGRSLNELWEAYKAGRVRRG